jgi:hypothetical protein
MAKQEPAPAPKYKLAELRENSKAVFGVRPEVLDGALYGQTAEEYTKDEVKAALDKFLKRPTKDELAAKAAAEQSAKGAE